MAYQDEDEVGRLICNHAQWSGDGVSVMGCGSLWNRIKREAWRSSLVLPVMGIEAGHVEGVVAAMREDLWGALRTYHLSALTFEMQARQLLRIAKSTYHQRLLAGHGVFIAAYCEQVQLAKARTRAFEIMGNTA